MLIAPAGFNTSGYNLSVPNNVMDVVAKAWCRGNYSNSGDANPATHRTIKPVVPTFLLDGDAVHYLWSLQEPLAKDIRDYASALRELARSIVALGWGIDLAVGDATFLSSDRAELLHGERWLPGGDAAEGGLRVPAQGALAHLINRHSQFLARLSSDGLRAPALVSGCRMVEYTRATSRPSRSIAAFSLLKLDASGFRAFDAVRHTPKVARMMRGAVERIARQSGWPEAKISTAVMGHGEAQGASQHMPVESPRFAWLPLPSLEFRQGGAHVVGPIRRVIVTSFAESFDQEIAWARRMLSGEEVRSGSDQESEALLSVLPYSERTVREYIRRADTWATVTPVVLPGYDDPDHYRRRLKNGGIEAAEQWRLLDRMTQRIDRLLRKAIVQAGLSPELANHAKLEWRDAGFWPGVDLAHRYVVPDHLQRFPRLHVSVSWRDRDNRPLAIPGPVCIGGGRFYGLGLFAAV